MLVRHARQRHENLGMLPPSPPPIIGLLEPRRPRLGMILRLPQTGHRARRLSAPRGVKSPSFSQGRVFARSAGQRIVRRGKCPGRPTINQAMRKPPVRGILVGPHGTVAERVNWAISFRARRRGVRGRGPLDPDEALVIWPCRQVHTIGVPFPLDAVFCDERMLVLHVETLSPRRISRRVGRARCCVELRGGRAEACGVVPGVRLSLEESA
jgi:hypothetical protein